MKSARSTFTWCQCNNYIFLYIYLYIPIWVKRSPGISPPTQTNLSNVWRAGRGISPWKMLIRQVLTRRSSLRQPSTEAVFFFPLSLALSFYLSNENLWLFSFVRSVHVYVQTLATKDQACSWLLRFYFLNWVGVKEIAAKWGTRQRNTRKYELLPRFCFLPRIPKKIFHFPCGISRSFHISVSISPIKAS